MLYAELSLNQTCWAGIGFSSSGTMLGASVFVIGTLDGTTPLVATYSPSTAPLAHVSVIYTSNACACVCVSVTVLCTYSILFCVSVCQAPPVLNKDQSAIKSFEITMDAGFTHIRFITTLTQLIPGPTLIWAFCGTANTTALA